MSCASLWVHHDDDELIAIACRVIRRLWRPSAPTHPFRPVRELAAEWIDAFPQGHARHDRPFPPPLIGRATELARSLAQPQDDEVVVNHDTHGGNILSAEREPWLLIDPKPLVGDSRLRRRLSHARSAGRNVHGGQD